MSEDTKQCLIMCTAAVLLFLTLVGGIAGYKIVAVIYPPQCECKEMAK